MSGVESRPVAQRALKDAAEWFAVLSFAPVSPEEQARWRRWLEAHPDHRRAWARVEAVDADLATPRSLPDHQRQFAAAALDNAAEQLRRRRRALRLLTLVGSVGVLGVGAARHAPTRGWISALASDQRSATGEIRRLPLAGGGTLWLASASAVDLHDDPLVPGGQRLRLLQGEVLVETGRGAGARALVVETPQGRLAPLGTRFSVRLQGEGAHTLLAVFEGRVQVHLAGARAAAPLTLGAGQQWVLGADGVQSEQAADPGREAWARGLLLVDGMRLEDVAAELSRYRRGRLACAPAVADLRVTGGFPLQDTDRALAMLADALPVQVRRILPWWVGIEPRQPPKK